MGIPSNSPYVMCHLRERHSLFGDDKDGFTLENTPGISAEAEGSQCTHNPHRPPENATAGQEAETGSQEWLK